ncbi:hypothetical protein HYQ46_012699 [Verticillium longisporum]|nr:hypothetical protein HYQ46_012699 [Verticillium longisporum]
MEGCRAKGRGAEPLSVGAVSGRGDVSQWACGAMNFTNGASTAMTKHPKKKGSVEPLPPQLATEAAFLVCREPTHRGTLATVRGPWKIWPDVAVAGMASLIEKGPAGTSGSAGAARARWRQWWRT